MSEPISENKLRFGGVQRLFGEKGLERIRKAHIAVIGLGGVGSWAAEALARSGLGQLTLIDFDDICITNTNRQVQALQSNLGQMKTSVLKKRFLDISPQMKVFEIQQAFTKKSAEEIMAQRFTVVIDCIDSLSSKCHLIDYCRSQSQDLVVVGGSAGRRDPSQVKTNDLSRTEGDRLLHKVRKKLRQDFNFPRDLQQKWGISTIYSAEDPIFLNGEGEATCDPSFRPAQTMSCEEGLGSVSFVTGSFGFLAASEAVKICVQ